MLRYSRPDQYELLVSMSDEDLMHQFQTGSTDAYQILVDRYRERLLFFIKRIVRDAATCEDILQEALLRVYRNRHSYQQVAKFSTWLYTITRNLAFGEYRKNKVRTVQSFANTGSDGETYEIDIPDEDHSPEYRAEVRQQVEFLHKAMEYLPKKFREVIILRDVQQLTYAEIVVITGLPEGTVKSRIHRARSALQHTLQKIYRPDDIGKVGYGAADTHSTVSSPGSHKKSPSPQSRSTRTVLPGRTKDLRRHRSRFVTT